MAEATSEQIRSKDIVMDMIKTMANIILRNKLSCIQGKAFTIMVDENTDLSTKEQCAIVKLGGSHAGTI